MQRLMLLLALALMSLSALAPTAEAQTRLRTRCFNQTGFCVSGAILDYWERNGGLDVFGYPITDLHVETVEGAWTGLTQWFERDRIEDHTNEGKGILAGRLGARALERQGRPWQTFPGAPGPGSSECRYFSQTRQLLCPPFRQYWERNGGLERFGYPVTPVFEETTTLDGGKTWRGQVQYFERRRMEHHPENKGTPYEVQLGLLGKALYQPTPQSREQMAQAPLIQFLMALATHEYRSAAAMYGGSYEQLRGYNPDIKGDPNGNPEISAQLLQRACEQNGFQCLPLRNVVETRATTPDKRSWAITVEFSTLDGKLYRRAADNRSRFTFTVTQRGQYFVQDLPPYAP